MDSVEIDPGVWASAPRLLEQARLPNVHVRIGDGYDGRPEHAPFDAIVLTAAPAGCPQPLLAQLRVGGRLVAPVGRGVQDLVVITKTERGLETEKIEPSSCTHDREGRGGEVILASSDTEPAVVQVGGSRSLPGLTDPKARVPA